MSNSEIHLQDELSQSTARITVQTRFGPVTGGKAINGTSVFLGIFYFRAMDLKYVSSLTEPS